MSIDFLKFDGVLGIDKSMNCMCNIHSTIMIISGVSVFVLLHSHDVQKPTFFFLLYSGWRKLSLTSLIVPALS